jgi:hypothetical protein
MVEQYGRVKRFFRRYCATCISRRQPAGEHTLSAIHYLTELNGLKQRILDDAPEHIITGPWKRLVYDAEGRIQRAGYSLCLLERLQDALRRRDIWLENSDRWGNPREKLLQGKNGRLSGSPFAGRWDIPLMDIKACNSWRSSWMKPGKPSHPALKEMRRFIFAMTVNILP